MSAKAKYDDEYLAVGNAGAHDFNGFETKNLGIGSIGNTLAEHHAVGQKDRHAQGAQKGRQPGGRAQRFVGHMLHGHSQNGDIGHGHAEDDDHGEDKMGFHPTYLLQGGQNDDPDKCPGRKQLTMGKIDQFDDAVNHGVAQSDQGVDTAKKYGVDKLL